MATPHTLTAFWDDGMLEHRPPDGEFELEPTGRLADTEPHPDRPLRVENVRSILRAELSDRIEWQGIDPADRETIERVHTAEYLTRLRDVIDGGGGRVTPETPVSEGTWDAAELAVGGAVAAVEHVASARRESSTGLESSASREPSSSRESSASRESSGLVASYALVRPSGHHAQPDRADGFCVLNNVAVATEVVLDRPDVDRVAVVDWDVHHGNGTQEAFYEREDVLVVSVHNDHPSWNEPAHPQTGALDEDGVGNGEGYTVNVPLPPGTGDAGYGAVFDRLVEPIVRSYDPDVLVVSAGQDAGVVDPLGRNVVTMEGFRDLGARARKLAVDAADGRLALVQEGGYQVSHLAYATLAVLEGTLGVDTGIEDPYAWLDEDLPSALEAVERAAEYHDQYWPLPE